MVSRGVTRRRAGELRVAMARRGVRVMRFSASEVLHEIEGVVTTILAEVGA